MKWWGWGEESLFFSPENRPGFIPYLKQTLQWHESNVCQTINIEEIKLPPSRLPEEVKTFFSAALKPENIRKDLQERIRHSMGKSYIDLIRMQKGNIPHPPDAVLYPETVEEVQRILQIASQNSVAIVPFGGGTSVVGGVEAIKGSRHSSVISMDLSRMNRLLSLDAISGIATAQAGIRGPDLETALNAQGFTLSHFPQSFEFSTLGGWVATRSAGQTSTKYGKIEDMVVSLTLVSGKGTIQTRCVPASATGPSLSQMLIGSEGVLGIITDVTIRIHRRPDLQDYRGFYFRSFEDGTEAIRRMIQTGLRPSVLRLSDSMETEVTIAWRTGTASFKDRLGKKILGWRGFEHGCLLILGFEGESRHVNEEWRSAMIHLRNSGAFALGRRIGEAWKKERFYLPYIRDWLLEHCILIDTLETAALWSRLPQLYARLKISIQGVLAQLETPPLVLAHLSHAYDEGASLYFTFLSKQLQGREFEQWQAVKKEACRCILENGGTISHHHGIGTDHASWLQQEHGITGVAAFGALKATLDPAGILNPGKLFV